MIPKVKNPCQAKNFRSISLRNVVYKLASKVLVDRLKQLLSTIISKYQSAIVPSMLIFDNVLIAYEALHTMTTRKKGKEDSMTLKVDMTKAYDRVEWKFLEGMLKRMGFNEKWITLIMMCVTIVGYAILINGIPSRIIYPKRGIRQGNPISPYLFLLCAEGLSALMSDAKLHGRIKGVKIAPGCPSISHFVLCQR